MHLASKLPAHSPDLYRCWERIYSFGIQVGNHSRDVEEESVEMERAEGIDPGVPDEPIAIDLPVDEVAVVNDES